MLLHLRHQLGLEYLAPLLLQLAQLDLGCLLAQLDLLDLGCLLAQLAQCYLLAQLDLSGLSRRMHRYRPWALLGPSHLSRQYRR